ncbi:hypothetical protein Rhe02_14090 [Rhizocola hellebori]|uniref:YgjV family protein n=1 Tax=Rhizocola hellebori TaxID=1392758 RepID=A0A8J3VEH8_9ACTN|nr:hypothetical protein [Rhizocola hellebori]GIH03342.1 hypothetical protein Rhe02_14090 [Rhizocola hellebori]
MNWLDLIGWAGSALLVWSLLQTRILRLRVFNLIGCFVLIFFNAALAVWPMVGLNVVLAIINVVYLRKMLATRHDDHAYTAVEVHADDAFLTYVLDIHAADIERFNPGFKRSGDELAFVVMHDDELAGVVLIFDRGGGTAQIELDYVTQRFRDFTPGEFVYRRSGLFSERGFRRVVTPPGMVSPYYGRIGFKREGDVYVLEM